MACFYLMYVLTFSDILKQSTVSIQREICEQRCAEAQVLDKLCERSIEEFQNQTLKHTKTCFSTFKNCKDLLAVESMQVVCLLFQQVTLCKVKGSKKSCYSIDPTENSTFVVYDFTLLSCFYPPIEKTFKLHCVGANIAQTTFI